jgi:hypothetical protein
LFVHRERGTPARIKIDQRRDSRFLLAPSELGADRINVLRISLLGKF